ncbi:MAG: hypothetical protein KY459_07295 [Acidobacteria bacterium]|nr:hypothetical protein [Acidobacteriota bacterium]
MFSLSFSIASAQEQVLERMQARAKDVKRIGGWILVTVGTWLLILAIFAQEFSRVFTV